MKTLTTLLLIISTFPLFAYVPMLEQGHHWRSIEGGWFPSLVSYQTEGSAVLDGEEYQIIRNYYGEIGENQGSAFYLREDETTEQVWLRWNENTEEILYYDFSLTVGESVVYGDCNIQATCTSVEEVLMADGITRKHITVLENEGWYQETWIEGIGCTHGPIAPGAYYCIADWDPSLQCFFKDGDLVYTNPNVQENCAETNVNEESNSTWDFLHSGNTLSLAGNETLSYRILDLSGRCIQAGTMYPGKVLNLSAFARGSYIITAWNQHSKKSKRILLCE